MNGGWNPISRASRWIAERADLRESTVTDWWRVNIPAYPFRKQSRGVAHQQMASGTPLRFPVGVADFFAGGFNPDIPIEYRRDAMPYHNPWIGGGGALDYIEPQAKATLSLPPGPAAGYQPFPKAPKSINVPYAPDYEPDATQWEVPGETGESPAASYQPDFGGNGMNGSEIATVSPDSGLQVANGGGGLPLVQGALPPSVGIMLLKTWEANGRPFYMFARNGRTRIGTFKSNGVWKEWSPYRPVVLGKRPSVAKVRRVAGQLDKFVKSFRKVASVLGYKVSRS